MEIGLLYIIALIIGMDYLTGGEGVKIRNLVVPDMVQGGTAPVVLDCDYVLDEAESPNAGLVVKWFFNKHPTPVSQWIYTKTPQYLGVLKGRVNENYTATQDNTTMYRAIQLRTPVPELSGEYKCLVSTFNKEDWRSKKMTVFVPEKSLEMMTQKPTADRVVVNCQAEGVFPEPNMTITAQGSADNGFLEVTTKKQNNSSLFDIQGMLTMEEAHLTVPTEFICELTIPEANHYKRKELVWYPGLLTTPAVQADYPGSPPSSGASGHSVTSSTVLLTLTLLTICVSNRPSCL